MKKTSLSYTVLRSNRKTIAIQINTDGTVLVRSPLRMPQEEIRKFVDSKSKWIEKYLEKLNAKPTLPPLTNGELARLADLARERIPQRVAYYAPLVGVTYGKITIRNQRSRWGSCSCKGNLNFNCLLMLAPCEVVDYVVVHELCHRMEMNHSKAFWSLVENILPDYKMSKKWLKENGSALIGRLTFQEAVQF